MHLKVDLSFQYDALKSPQSNLLWLIWVAPTGHLTTKRDSLLCYSYNLIPSHLHVTRHTLKRETDKDANKQTSLKLTQGN